MVKKRQEISNKVIDISLIKVQKQRRLEDWCIYITKWNYIS